MAFGNALAFPFHRSKLAAAVEWSPAKLFEDGEAGGWYDPTYQMNEDDYPAWQTVFAADRADEVGDPVGLYLSNPRDGRGIVNTLIYSDLSTTTGWGPGGVTPNFADGYCQIVENSSTAEHWCFSTSGSAVVSGETYSGYFVVKKGVLAGAPDIIQVSTRAAGFGGGAYANFDLASGTVTQSANATAFIYDADNIPTHLSGVNLQTGEYLVGITTTATSTTSTNAGLLLSFVNNNPTASRGPIYAGSTDADVLVRAAQFQQGSPSAYQANGPYRGGPGEHFGQATSAARPTLRLDGSYYMLEFDGGDYLTLGKPALGDGCNLFADNTQKWVISGVFKLPTNTSGDQTLVAKASATEADRTFHSFVSGTAIGARVRGTANSFSGNFADDAAHWYMFYWDGSTLWLYVDDDEPYTLSVGSAAVNTDEPILIGARTIAAPATFFTGYHNLLLLRSGEISATDIEQVRNWAKREYGVV